MLNEGLVTTLSGTLPIGDGVTEVSICVHSDTPVRANSFPFYISITPYGHCRVLSRQLRL